MCANHQPTASPPVQHFVSLTRRIYVVGQHPRLPSPVGLVLDLCSPVAIPINRLVLQFGLPVNSNVYRTALHKDSKDRRLLRALWHLATMACRGGFSVACVLDNPSGQESELGSL